MLTEDILHFLLKGIFLLFEGVLLGIDGFCEDCIKIHEFDLIGLVVLHLQKELLKQKLVLTSVRKCPSEVVVLLDDAVDADVAEGSVRRHTINYIR
jgi:hypothetical protein